MYTLYEQEGQYIVGRTAYVWKIACDVQVYGFCQFEHRPYLPEYPPATWGSIQTPQGSFLICTVESEVNVHIILLSTDTVH